MGRYNITLNLKHRAIYFSDSSHRLPPPPLPLWEEEFSSTEKICSFPTG